ncbi:TM2 domain-containing protein 2 isoform X1 [Thunnus maccoyii]|uniref:TM2 domain-containing protein 2 isoform X1 n=1 Tax=Thunnus maccoyii TaxID=8240 RepID=UPI001C4C4C14|nr:TM2 domain-containing protein 2 isoform X1 [Thunnus maccoyii]
MISVSYILLCGQLLLLLTVILLQCLEGIHSQNSTTAETPATVPGEGATTLPSTKQPPVVVKDDISAESANNTEAYEYRPPSPVVLCSYLPEEFIYCQDPVDHAGNYSAYQEMGHGCVVWGGQTEREVNHTEVMCTALDDIECAGPRDFLRGDVPCINQHCSGWMKERPDGGGGGEVMGRNRPAGTPDTISSPLCCTPSSWVVSGLIVSAWATPAPLWGSCSPWEDWESGGSWT